MRKCITPLDICVGESDPPYLMWCTAPFCFVLALSSLYLVLRLAERRVFELIERKKHGYRRYPLSAAS